MMPSLDQQIQGIVEQARGRLSPAPARRLISRDEQLRIEFALSVIEFLPSDVNLMNYDLASNPHLPFVLCEDEPWKAALCIEGDVVEIDTVRHRLPSLRLSVSLEPLSCDPMPEWAAA